MTEKSYWWTTGGAGDGASTYTRVDLQHVGAVLAAGSHYEGVGPSYLNECAGSVGGANQYDIDTGGAVVDGKPYRNDAAVNVTIPSAVGSGNERIDRIVLRADWTAQTVRITRIAGTDAAEPTPPSVTKSSGTTYDIMLYQVRVDESGTVTTELDEREWAVTPCDGVTLENSAGSIRIKNDGVTNAKIRNSSACSVIGRASNSTGDPADISGGTNDRVLARASNSLSFQQVSLAMIANDSVDDTKVGNRVPMLTRRQGSSTTDWDESGTTNYTPTAVKIQCGKIDYGIITAGDQVSKVITFPQAFSYKPLIFATLRISASSIPEDLTISVYTVSTSQTEIIIRNFGTNDKNVTLNWLAIGPE